MILGISGLVGLTSVLLALAALPVLACTTYLFVLVLLSGRKAPPAAGEPRMRFEVIVPSHNEEAGIGETVKSLLLVDYPPDLRRIVVVADNCVDATAERAREAGAMVLVRNDATQRGKGYALNFAFERCLAEGFADAVLVVDADTSVSPNLLRAFAARFESGVQAVQAEYGVRNPNASWRTRLMVIALALFHELRSRARERLGVSCGLRGNGMGFTRRILAEIPHDAFSIVEDVEYGIRLGRAGHRVAYVAEANVRGDMVATAKESRSQRERWEGGRIQMARRYGVPLVGEGLAKKSLMLFDLGMDLIVPPLTYVVLAAVLGFSAAAVLAVMRGSYGDHVPLVPLVPWGMCAAMLGAYVLRGVVLAGVGVRGFLDLLFAPAYMIWKLALNLRRKKNKGEWVRTAREGEKPS